MENTGKSDERHQTADMVRMFKNNPAGLSAGWNRHVLPAFPRGSICWTQPWTSLNRVSSSLPWHCWRGLRSSMRKSMTALDWRAPTSTWGRCTGCWVNWSGAFPIP